VDTHHNTFRFCRVTQWSHQVEDGRDTDFSPGNTGVLHGWVIGLSEQEAESMLVQ